MFSNPSWDVRMRFAPIPEREKATLLRPEARELARRSPICMKPIKKATSANRKVHSIHRPACL
jgi:hypothetical protein